MITFEGNRDSWLDLDGYEILPMLGLSHLPHRMERRYPAADWVMRCKAAARVAAREKAPSEHCRLITKALLLGMNAEEHGAEILL